MSRRRQGWRAPAAAGAMRILAVINDQDVARKILDHLQLWQGLTADEITCRIRDGPVPAPELEPGELTAEPYMDDWGDQAEGARQDAVISRRRHGWRTPAAMA